MHRLYCSTLVAALLLGASLIADAGSCELPDPSGADAAAIEWQNGDLDGFLLIATDETGEITGIDLVTPR